MKNLLFTLTLIASSFLTFSFTTLNTENEDLKLFSGSYEQALEASKTQEKPLLLISFWEKDCYWCNQTNKNTLKDADVINYLNKNFIVIKQNVAEGEYEKLGSRLGIRGYSAILFLRTPLGISNKKEKRISEISTYKKPKQFLKAARKAKKYYNKKLKKAERYKEHN